jgi:hypothetical protein
MLARKLTAFVAVSLAVAGPASAQSAAPLSLANSPAGARAGGQLGDASDLHGGFTTIIVAAAVLGILIFVLTQLGNDNQLPGSP